MLNLFEFQYPAALAHSQSTETESILAPFASVDSATRIIPNITTSGVQPMILEYIDRGTMKGLLRMNNMQLGIPEDITAATDAYFVVALETSDAERLECDTTLVAEVQKIAARDGAKLAV